MKTVEAEYAVIRLFILGLVHEAKVLRRLEIFNCLQKLPTAVFQIKIVRSMVERALEDLVEECLLEERMADKTVPAQFLLTPSGLAELRHDGNEAGMIVDGLRAIRTLFPKSAV